MADRRVSREGGVRVPRDPEELQSVFDNHYGYYANTIGEVVHTAESGEGAIQREYSGRVVFELLQNAIDRAEDLVFVGVIETDFDGHRHVLAVANDGVPVQVNPQHDYENPPDVEGPSEMRSDFNALCSLHTSNKSPDESIGTKGIGFSSVFHVDSYVRVWSRLQDASCWWGIEMHSPFTAEVWERRKQDTDIQRGVDRLLSEDPEESFKNKSRRPSYHFPFPLLAEDTSAPILDSEWPSTVVVVPIPDEKLDIVTNQIDQLERHHLYFTGLSAGTGTVDVTIERPGGNRFERRTWPDDGSDWHLSFWQSDGQLQRLATDAELDVEAPVAGVIWPSDSATSDSPAREPAIYGYLPTLMEGPFGVDVQGDFQLSIDRTNLRLDEDAMGPYNRRLLLACAELHVLEALKRTDLSPGTINWKIIDPEVVEHHPDSELQAPDLGFWHHLDPAEGESPGATVVKDHVEELLFSEGDRQEPERFAIWAALAAGFFDTREKWPLRTYNDFWEASIGWISRVCAYKSRGSNWRKVALAMCDALREESAQVAPVVLEAEPEPTSEFDAVPLPPRRDVVGRGGHLERSERELFLRSPDLPQPKLPSVLRENDRVVTTFDFKAADLYETRPNALGVREFNRWELLSEVRQLPNSLSTWTHEPMAHGNPTRATEWQQELIEFAAELFMLDTGSRQQAPAETDQFSVGWRVADHISENQRRAGRALSTLFLPTNEDKWQPARELHIKEVDRSRLGNLPEDLPLEKFLIFLGVAKSPPDDGVALRLIEGGSNGVVGAVEVPPVPTPAGRGQANVTFHSMPRVESDEPNGWRASLREAWDEWLEHLIRLERQARSEENDEPVRTAVLDPLRDGEWYPIGEEGADPPVGVDVDGGGVAPRHLALVSRQQHQLPRVIWSVDREIHDTDTAILRELGTVPGLDIEELREDNADPAFKLLDQLQRLDLDTIQQDPRDRQALDRLFDRVLTAIVRGHNGGDPEDIGLLVASGSKDTTLGWASPSQDVWIPETPQDREVVRKYFPEERCVVATLPQQPLSNYAPLAGNGIEVNRIVRSDPPEGVVTDDTLELRERIQETIPVLLALVEATTRIDVDTSEVMDRWGSDVVKEADCVWQEIRVCFGDNPPQSIERLRDTSGEVLVRSGEYPCLVFDREDEQLPPVADFGEALATVLLGDQGKEVDSLFARALTAKVDEQSSLERLVERKGAAQYVGRFRAEFLPLDEEERTHLREEVEAALTTLDIGLDVSSAAAVRDLSPSELDLAGASEEVTERDVRAALAEVDLPPTRKWDWYQPRFACFNNHQRRWRGWFDRHEGRLVPYLEEYLIDQGVEDATASAISRDLDTFVREEWCPRVNFEPDEAVVAWLSRFDLTDDVPPATELVKRARQHERRFEPVEEILAGDHSFNPRTVDEPTPREEETGRISMADATRKTRAQMRVGEDAEEAVVDQILGETISSLDQAVEAGAIPNIELGLERLTWALPENGVTISRLEEACASYLKDGDPSSLAEGLHVSKAWDGAGFDLLGLLFEEGELVPIRSEIKALSNELPASVHLSTNQLAVYERVELRESEKRRYTGKWRLLGVEPSGTAHDLTPFLRDLPQTALLELWQRGFDHDGLILTIEESDRLG